MIGWRAAAVVALAGLTIACAAPERTRGVRAAADASSRIVLIVVDGLDARDVGDDTPYLARVWRESPWCPNAHGRAAMPARTNVNHATLLTGVVPETHGITGNAFWDRAGEPRKLGAAPDFLTETLFTRAHAHTAPVATASAVGKGKLALMFAATPGGQSAPTRSWGPTDAGAEGREAITGYSFDLATLDGARTLLTDDVAFVLVNLADVDRVNHGAGPHTPEATATRRATDAAIAAFIGDLQRRSDWQRTTVVITADHGFDTVVHEPIAFADRLIRAGLGARLVNVSDGGVSHVYLRDRGAADAPDLLARARRAALATPGIGEALYLVPNPRDDGDTHLLGRVHPDWGLAHERAGDLLLIAAPGYVLAEGGGDEARLKGNHGAPPELDVPVIILRGASPGPSSQCEGLTAADLGRTLLHCLALGDVARLDGSPIADSERGRLLPGLCD